MEGSYCFSNEFNQWVMARFFISETIHKDGTILDIGCANGFLLRCLKEWSEYNLNPFGIDKNKRLIKESKRLFPDISGHFIMKNLNDIDRFHKDSFPKKFDFIYWNMWDNCKIKRNKKSNIVFYWSNHNYDDQIELTAILNNIKKGGRLIIGISDSKNKILSLANNLKEMNRQVSDVLTNPHGTNEEIIYIER